MPPVAKTTVSKSVSGLREAGAYHGRAVLLIGCLELLRLELLHLVLLRLDLLRLDVLLLIPTGYSILRLDLLDSLVARLGICV